MTQQPVGILVVDDAAAGRYFKAHVLRKAGYSVAEAASGTAAIEHCRKSQPDLVLLDTRLPDLDGVIVCREIKNLCPGVAVLQTSAALTTGHDRALSLEGGADVFLVEPIEPEELLASARALLRLRGAEQELRRLNESLETLVAERTRELTATNLRLEIESAERRKAEDTLWHTQKLEVVGRLTGGIAHDFNNLLAIVVGGMEVIRGAVQDPSDAARAKVLRMLKMVETATDRGAKLTRQLLAFARRGTLLFEVVGLDEVIIACEPFLRRALGDTATLKLSLEPDLWFCRIDPAQFEAAILNLVVNAHDAMPAGGTLEIATANLHLGEAAADRPEQLAPGDYVRVRVTDTGTGMDPDVAAHVFEPFFTTKEVGKGTGLGLSQVYGFVKQSDGVVTVDTGPGVGTTFTLYLPRCVGMKAAPDAPDRRQQALPTGTETVLVVEDNTEVRELAAATISELGYRVLTAEDGASALKILDHEAHVDLLFSDVAMPGGIDGFELVRRACGEHHGLKALITSGYANVQRPGANRPDVPLLVKPYHRAELAERIRVTLDAA